LSIDMVWPKNLLKSLNQMRSAVHHTLSMNKRRSKAYVGNTKQDAQNNKLRFAPNTPATRQIQTRKHSPMSFYGEMMNNIKTRTNGQNTESGFFQNDPSKPTAKDRCKVGRYNKPARITWYKIALLHTTGYKIPLQGEKGRRVRKFLAAHGIFPSATKEFLIVVPRPILKASYQNYIKSMKDDIIIDKYFDKMWSHVL